jgi:hypothetical protein
MIGGHAAGAMVIARSPNAMVAFRRVTAFPTGVEFDVEAHARGISRSVADKGPWPNFEVRFFDSRRAALSGRTAQRPEIGAAGLSAGRWTSGYAGGAHGDSDVNHFIDLWLWPLPPSGSVIFTTSWIEAGIPESEVTLNGADLRAAAEMAVSYWDPD